jgi:hypothetical protein
LTLNFFSKILLNQSQNSNNVIYEIREYQEAFGAFLGMTLQLKRDSESARTRALENVEMQVRVEQAIE